MSIYEAATQALEALERGMFRGELIELREQAIIALRTALEPVIDNHKKEGDKLTPPSDHIPNATKMMASVREDRTVEPVAYVTGYFGGRCVIRPVEPVIFPVGMALYLSPPNQSEDALDMVEPVAYIHESGFLVKTPGSALTAGMKLYAAPPKREPLTEQELEPIRRRMMMEAYNAADDGDFERYNALKVMANDVLEMLLGGEK